MYKLTAVDTLPGRDLYSRGKNQAVLKDFIESGNKIALYEGWGNKNVSNAVKCLVSTAKRYNLPVYVVVRSGKVYLVRKDV